MSIHSSIQCSGDQIINSAQEENEPDLFFSCKSSLDLELVRVQIAEEGFNDIAKCEKGGCLTKGRVQKKKNSLEFSIKGGRLHLKK